MFNPMKKQIICLLAVAIGVVGCGGNRVATVDPRTANLTDIFEVYSLFAKNHQRPPKQLSDLTRREYETTNPAGVRGLKSGEYVVVWGTVIGESSVLAYEKDVPQSGGMVVLADGNIKSMSASDLQVALKPKG